MATSVQLASTAAEQEFTQSVRRRSTTRTAGFKAAGTGATGRELKTVSRGQVALKAGEQLSLTLQIPKHAAGALVAYGGWFQLTGQVRVEVECAAYSKKTLVAPQAPDWGKIGSMWQSLTGQPCSVRITFTAETEGSVALHEMRAGTVQHKHLATLTPAIAQSMYRFAPEANFYAQEGAVAASVAPSEQALATLALKCCNRCARYLPINLNDEQIHLSFTNHCTGASCTHGGFSRLFEASREAHQALRYGYQMECRFCKKFEVNGPLNTQRNGDQYAEVSSRRQALEDLVHDLHYGGGLVHKDKAMRRAIAPAVLKRFGFKCFNCDEHLDVASAVMDHTLPVALFWPLDATATCLCSACNAEKRDRAPAAYYNKPGQLALLSELTGIPESQLRNPSPNMKVVAALTTRLDWFFEDFCNRPSLLAARDGKQTLDVFVSGLQKVLDQCSGGSPFNLTAEYLRRKHSGAVAKVTEQLSMF